ncbi:MAG: SirA family protein [Planctomycetota bacterium]|nr:MAG: SirA family protein [Planctomycetota bacterium]
MDEGRNVDARGLSCPQPVLMARKTLMELGSGEVSAIVDTMTQVENCIRTAESLGWTATYEEKDECFRLIFKK